MTGLRNPVSGWSHQEAGALIAAINAEAHACGWMLGLYGSTLTLGYGRDLDLLAVPWRQDALPDDVEATLARTCGARLEDLAPSAWDRSLGVAYRMPDGRVIDVLYVKRVEGVL